MQSIQTEGVRRSILDKLNALIDTTMAEGQLLDENVLDLLIAVTQATGREVLLMTDDKNTVKRVFIGDNATVSYGDDKMCSAVIGLNRIRVIHTHPGGNPRLSPEDCSSAVSQKLQCMVAVGVDENGLTRFGLGLPMVIDEELICQPYIVNTLKQLNRIDIDGYAAETNKALRALPDAGFDIVDTEERALLLGIDLGLKQGMNIHTSMTELARLVETAGGRVIEQVIQNRDRIDPVFYFGKGKLTETARLAQNTNANLIVTNDELNSHQIAAIEAATGCKCLDRTTVILDIFARHAKTKEGKLQVELAQHRYRLSHLKGLGQVLSRTGGGIGTRGPGEKKLEIDRRHIHRQIDELNARLAGIEKNNALAAKQRKRHQMRTVALVGYTNSGKSTLFNRMTDSEVIMKDALFVTLDATMRKINPEYGNYLLSDTVGFIEKLPHDLVKAFRTTLKEVEDADLLLHVVDAGNPDAENQIMVVENVLREIGAENKDAILVYNKMDSLSPEDAEIIRNKAERHNGCCISALTGNGIEVLNSQIHDRLNHAKQLLSFLIPYSDSKASSLLHENAEIIQIDYQADGTKITAEINGDFPLHRIEKYLIFEAAESEV